MFSWLNKLLGRSTTPVIIIADEPDAPVGGFPDEFARIVDDLMNNRRPTRTGKVTHVRDAYGCVIALPPQPTNSGGSDG